MKIVGWFEANISLKRKLIGRLDKWTSRHDALSYFELAYMAYFKHEYFFCPLMIDL
jgi:hypothetical protein